MVALRVRSRTLPCASPLIKFEGTPVGYKVVVPPEEPPEAEDEEMEDDGLGDADAEWPAADAVVPAVGASDDA